MTASDEKTETLSVDAHRRGVGGPDSEDCLQLVLLWSRHEPERVGESCVVVQRSVLGRGDEARAGDPPKVEFLQQRPGLSQPTGDLRTPTLSRRQWLLEAAGETLSVSNQGKRALFHNGVVARDCRARPGDTLAVEDVALFLVDRRPRVLARFDYEPFAFGTPDPDGLVGETPAMWSLRHELSLLRRSHAHVIIFGPSGSGKEPCVRAIHRGSPRGDKPLVSRNAATIPAGLVEAELFGNAPSYPHAGIPARLGLIGTADHGTLFLDEVGELAEREQANLLRVLDAGEYQRLGEDRPRRCDVRFMAATNRPPEKLKHDFLARFTERLLVPGLGERQADIPLMARDILRRIDGSPAGAALGLELTDALVRHEYTTHHRELERLVRVAAREKSGSELPLGRAVLAELRLPSTRVEGELTEAALRQALAEAGSASEAAKRLGLPSRFALYRLMKKATP